MNRYLISKVFRGVPVILAFIFVLPVSAHADWGHRYHHSFNHHYYPYGHRVVVLPHRFLSLDFGGLRLYYGDGHFYRRRVHDYIIVNPPVGAVVYSIPTGYSRVMVAGTPYYMYEGVYYRPVERGYQVVEAPEFAAPQYVATRVATAPVSAAPQDAFTINIPNANGGYTAVTLKKSGSGYVGPQGEFYSGFPKVEQLREMYGH